MKQARHCELKNIWAPEYNVKSLADTQGLCIPSLYTKPHGVTQRKVVFLTFIAVRT
jgi:hypothetical protein